MKISDYDVIEEEGGLLNDFQDEKIPGYRQPKTYLIIFIVVIILLAILVPIAIVKGNPDTLIRSIKTKNIMNHLQNLQDIANKNSGSRTATTGYNPSVDYVYNKLNKYNNYFNLQIQKFTYNNFVESEKPTFIVDGQPIVDKVRFQNLRFSGSGDLADYPVHSVGVGCTDQDWETFPKDNTTIAVIGRNDLIECNILQKITKSIEYEAAGVIIYNAQGQNTLFQAGLTTLAPFPIFAVGYDLGNEIANSDVKVTMIANNTQDVLETSNIIADTKSGNKDNTIVSGSHLDSVLAGPGINDNGSGSSVNLEIALLFAKLAYKPTNRVRFCWFGAEELGLFGSLYYVNNLNQEQIKEIALNLNYDMLGSPNYIMGVYNGTSSSVQSGNIQKVFEEYFNDNEIKFILSPFTGRSDYGPFLEKGIPAGGLFTGAEVIKSLEEFKTFGGVAQVAYDPCYHLSCDTIDNINQVALFNNAKAAAYAINFFAYNKEIHEFLNKQ